MVDEWGIGHVPTASADMVTTPHLEGFRYPMLDLESEANAAAYPLPDLDADYRYESVRGEFADIHGRGLASMAMLECTIFERAWYLRSMERLLSTSPTGTPSPRRCSIESPSGGSDRRGSMREAAQT